MRLRPTKPRLRQSRISSTYVPPVFPQTLHGDGQNPWPDAPCVRHWIMKRSLRESGSEFLTVTLASHLREEAAPQCAHAPGGSRSQPTTRESGADMRSGSEVSR